MIAEQYQFTMQVNDGSSAQGSAAVLPGGVRVLPFKFGPTISRIQSAATGLPFLSTAPRMLVSIYGNDLTMSTQTALSQPLPTELGGATVFVAGHTIELLYPSPLKINEALSA